VGEWVNLTDVHSAGGTRLTQYYTVELCLHVCRDVLDNCAGVDIDARQHDEIRCWVHTSVTDFDETYRSDGITQYRLVTSCAQPGTANVSLGTATYAKAQGLVGNQGEPDSRNVPRFS